ncbi:MAG: efflux RND transporter permease subunit, partial [Planctomycetota bacterium]
MAKALLNVYRASILRLPWLPLLIVLALVGVLASKLHDFKLNVSSDALILEKDPALRIYDASRLVFGSDDYVILAYEAENVFDEKNVELIARLTKELGTVRGVDRVMSLTSVKLFTSPKRGSLIGLMAQGGDPITLDSEDCNRELARAELTESGIYANNLVTPDGKKTALLVYLLQRSEGHEMERRIHEIDLALKDGGVEDAALAAERKELWDEFQVIVEERRTRRERVVVEIRKVLARYEPDGPVFHSSGLPVIFTDMMTYVRRDITLFSTLVGLLLFVVLAIVFRAARWVLLPMATGLATVAAVVGAMVAAGIQTTVITSNLSSLLMILTMAHSIHFAVRFEEETALDPTADRRTRILRTVRHIGIPCFYIACTTAVGFVSLIFSGIRPVIEFGQYMALGVMLAFTMTFILVPAGLALWPLRDRPSGPPVAQRKGWFRPLASLTSRSRWAILVAATALTVFSIVGVARLDVETVFIDYFHKDTEIYKGLRFIDTKLGGTSSLEVIFTADKAAYEAVREKGGTLKNDEGYFTTWERMEPIRKVEEYLNSVPEVGKVLSPITLM